jgi:hypothetical protein
LPRRSPKRSEFVHPEKTSKDSWSDDPSTAARGTKWGAAHDDRRETLPQVQRGLGYCEHVSGA